MRPIMRVLRCLVLPGVLLYLVGCDSAPGTHPPTSFNQEAQAWWLSKEFDAFATLVNKLPVANFDRGWIGASLLGDQATLAVLSAEELAQVESSGLVFALQADLNGDSTPEEYLTGVYQDRDGKLGRFLAIFQSDLLLRVFQQNGSAGFSALSKDGTKVQWFKCMECADYDSVVWTGRSFELE